MSEDLQKYENWRAITESDYVTMFIKTWFAFVATLREFNPVEDINKIIGKGDSIFINPYLEDFEQKYYIYNVFESVKYNILKVYQLGRQYVLENEKYYRFFNEDFYSLNHSFVFKKEDEHYCCTVKLKEKNKYGDSWVINIDELYGFMSGMKFEDKPYISPVKRNIRKSGEIWRAFQAEDPDTKIRKLNLRLFVKEQGIWYFVSSVGHWVIDADELMYKLNPRGIDCKVDMPRLRWHDDTVRRFRYLHQDIPVTINIVEKALQSESVFKVQNGHRWIINYDQLEMEVYKQLGRI